MNFFSKCKVVKGLECILGVWVFSCEREISNRDFSHHGEEEAQRVKDSTFQVALLEISGGKGAQAGRKGMRVLMTESR